MKKTFKDAVEKAIKNGFEPKKFKDYKIMKIAKKTKLPKEEYNLYYEYKADQEEYKGQPFIMEISINTYELIFATDFVDKLVGKGKCADEDNKLSVSIKNKVACKHNIYMVRNYGAAIFCKECSFYEDAAYHRSKMANIKDIDKLKEYVISLI